MGARSIHRFYPFSAPIVSHFWLVNHPNYVPIALADLYRLFLDAQMLFAFSGHFIIFEILLVVHPLHDNHTCHLIHLNTIFPTDFVQTFPFCEIPFVHLHSRFYTLSSIFGGYIMILVISPCLRFDVIGNIISPHIFRFHGNLFMFVA